MYKLVAEDFMRGNIGPNRIIIGTYCMCVLVFKYMDIYIYTHMCGLCVYRLSVYKARNSRYRADNKWIYIYIYIYIYIGAAYKNH